MQPDPKLSRRAHVVEDVGPSQAPSFEPVVQRLEAWQAPTPSAAETAALQARLQTALPPLAWYRRWLKWLDQCWPWLLMRAQLRVVRREIWTASALVLLIGMLVTVATLEPNTTLTFLPLVLIAPVVTAIGVALLYGATSDPGIELTLATPATPRIILLARLTLVYGFDLGLSLLASVALVCSQPNLPLWSLIAAWLIPMTALSALAFLLSVWGLDPLLSTTTSLLLWIMLAARQYAPLQARLRLVPDLYAWANEPIFWLALLGLLLISFWRAGNPEYWLRQHGS